MSNRNTAKRFVSFREAEKYGPKEKTWRNWYYKKLIPAVRMGRRIYLDEDMILEMIAKNTIPAREAQ